MVDIGKKIRNIMEIKGITQEELAHTSGVSISLIRKLVNKKCANTSIDTIVKISQALNVPVKYFFSNEIDDPFLNTHISEKIRSFLADKRNIPYIELAIEMREKKINPEFLKELIDLINKYKSISL